MKKNALYTCLLLLVVSVVVVIACSKSSGGYGSTTNNNPPPPANTVKIYNMAFTPATLTVTAGTTVTWNNSDYMTHTVTADDGSFDSGNIATGSKFTKLFSTAGTYAYHCSIHAGMKATIVVK